ncbi:hypothetical protein ACIBCA_28575 [Kitasatospora sp. NPDC051170]|uniref:hypothetical protein n=1 Tax=Kitasatospora sp. NPDC051170 TaxID=3364056 RepID=UPI0037AC20E7
MRNGLVQLGAWVAATGAAVLLSWLGVHAVLNGAAFERPTALPLPSPKLAGAPQSAVPTATPAPTPTPAQTETPASAPATAAATRAPAQATAPPTRRPTTPAPTATSTVQSVPVPGGRVALDLRPDKASLVSAVPDPGWQMKVWNGDMWLRVDFVKDEQANSVFVAWNGHAPIVETAVR